jgi:hypothetical protein
VIVADRCASMCGPLAHTSSSTMARRREAMRRC